MHSKRVLSLVSSAFSVRRFVGFFASVLKPVIKWKIWASLLVVLPTAVETDVQIGTLVVDQMACFSNCHRLLQCIQLAEVNPLRFLFEPGQFNSKSKLPFEMCLKMDDQSSSRKQQAVVTYPFVISKQFLICQKGPKGSESINQINHQLLTYEKNEINSNYKKEQWQRL